MTDLASRATTLLELHTSADLLILSNVWDVISAQTVAAVEGVRTLRLPADLVLRDVDDATRTILGYLDIEPRP